MKNQQSFSGFDKVLDEKQKNLIKQSWELISTDMDHFCKEFYRRFFKVNPSGLRLFEEQSMASQRRALTSMLATIISSLDDPKSLMSTIESLGGRHIIYGVEASDYKCFIDTICETIESEISTKFTPEIHHSWMLIMNEISLMLQYFGEKIKTEGFRSLLNRKFKEGKWKKSMVSLTLESIFIYQSEKTNKLRSSYALNDILVVEPYDTTANQGLSKYGFTIELSDGKTIIYFACATIDLQKQWINELSWRIKAHQRIFREDDAASESSNDSKRRPQLTKRMYKKYSKKDIKKTLI